MHSLSQEGKSSAARHDTQDRAEDDAIHHIDKREGKNHPGPLQVALPSRIEYKVSMM